MKRYSMTEARQRLAELLDTAERGERVAIERRGIRFVVEARRQPRRRPVRRTSIIERMDRSVASGQWTWAGAGDALRFERRRSRR